MSDSEDATVHHRSEGSIAGTHAGLFVGELALAATMVDEQNTLKAAILPVACFRVEDLLFDFDSSFVLPEIQKHVPHLAALRAQHADKRSGLFPPLSVFGHADPTGDDSYNKSLSGRRAKAVYALFTRREDLWEELFSHPLGADNWKERGPGIMLAATGRPATDDDAKQVRNDASLRAKLFRAYMDKLCGPFQLNSQDGPRGPSDFLAHGLDPKGKGDFQGCSDFNPVLIFSQQDQDGFAAATDKTARNQANASNRRVMVFLFKPGARATPGRWPCPRADEGVAGCHARFWSDAERRRHSRAPDRPRSFEATRDTFACRFYDRLADGSPCEKLVELSSLILRIRDAEEQPIANAAYRLIVGDAEFTGVTTETGGIVHRVPKDSTTGELILAQGTILLTIQDVAPLTADKGIQTRLDNLGFVAGPPTDGQIDDPLRLALLQFQNRNGLETTGKIDQNTRQKLEEQHGS
jgi:hypothetical protein